jgi:hypothetical protein
MKIHFGISRWRKNKKRTYLILKKNGIYYCICLFFITFPLAHGQTRGSIPETLLRPGWGESSRYPLDLVIGELGQGRASAAAYTYANSIAAGLLSGQVTHSALVLIEPSLRRNYLNSLGKIAPRSFRVGGGRQEPDGAVSFLVRFIGRDYGITGELYIKFSSRQNHEDGEETGSWIFDELLLEEAKSHNEVNQVAMSRLDLLPYERFF